MLAWTHRRAGTSLTPAIKHAAAMTLFPLSTWFAARMAFCGGLGGTYISRHLDSWTDLLRKFVVAISVWPLGHDIEPVAASLGRMVRAGGTSGLLPGDAANLWFVLVNMAFAVFFTLVLLRVAIHRRATGMGPRAWAVLYWVLPASALLLALGLEKRFGYLLYLFGIPLLGRLVETCRWRPLRLASVAYLLVQCLLGAGAFAQLLSPAARASRHEAYERARNLVHLLETVSAMEDRRRTVYLVNDLVGDHAGPLLRCFATRDPKADLVVLTSRTNATPHFVKTSEGIEVSLTMPRGESLVFPGVDAARMLPLLQPSAEGLVIARNEIVSYRFPGGSIRTSIIGDLPRIEFGDRVDITVEDRGAIFVYFDTESGEHRIELPWTH